jgi:RNA polymerase sigma factor (sigma-70 family)
VSERVRLRRRQAAAKPVADFGDFYDRNAEAILAFFARRVLDPELALDLTAETFAQAFKSRHRFRGDGDEQARAWLYGIARHQLSQYRRRGAAERRALGRLGIEVPDLSADDYERVEELAGLERVRTAAQNGMAELSEGVRRAVRLRIIDELSYPEIAKRLSISEEAARQRVSRGLRGLSAAAMVDDEEGT